MSTRQMRSNHRVLLAGRRATLAITVAALGFGLATMDVRQHASKHHAAVAALYEAAGVDHRMGPGGFDVATLTRVCRPAGTDCVMVFSLETESPEASVHTRMFAPSLGVPVAARSAAPATRIGCSPCSGMSLPPPGPPCSVSASWRAWR